MEDQLGRLIDELLGFVDVIESAAPHVWDAAISSVYADVASEITWVILLLLGAIVFFAVGRRQMKVVGMLKEMSGLSYYQERSVSEKAESNYISGLLLYIATGLAVFTMAFPLTAAIQRIIATEWYAIEKILLPILN